MALIQVNFMSQALMRTVPVNVILPVDKFDRPGAAARPCAPFQTLYLLHGVFGNYTDWVSGTCIQRWAEEKKLAVVMPSGDNMFYVNQPGAHNLYGEYIGRELVDITRRMFPLSTRREDTYIAGLSMGGYGALRNGLKYCETFGRIAGLSSANIIDRLDSFTEDAPFFLNSKSYVESAFGPLDKVRGSDKDLIWLAKQAALSACEKPSVYLACGTEDSLLEMSRALRDNLTALGFLVTYEESGGRHDWDFWNRSIKKVLDWLPLDAAAAGLNSGNVRG